MLLTNDDGVGAEGLRELGKRLARASGVDLSVIAPDMERSACGHAVTLLQPIRARSIELPEMGQSSVWSVSGTPADCVKLAIGRLLTRRPDLVVSGINRGANLATDVFYSGTVSAAIEAAIQGIPAVAVSLAAYGGLDYGPAADFAVALVLTLKTCEIPGFTILNVNVPAVRRGEIAGVRLTRMGIATARDTFEVRRDPRGLDYYWLQSERVVEGWDDESDVMAVRQNFISVTPLQLDLTLSPSNSIANLELPKIPWEQGG